MFSADWPERLLPLLGKSRTTFLPFENELNQNLILQSLRHSSPYALFKEFTVSSLVNPTLTQKDTAIH